MPGGSHLRPPFDTALAAAAYLAAMVLLAWPLPRALAGAVVDPLVLHGSMAGRADLDLLCWILAWVAHALAHAPGSLFDGNVFHPAPNVLVGSEHLLGLTPVSVPVFLASGNAALTYNACIGAVILAAALSTFALVRAWTGDRLAAWSAGAAFAFSPQVLFGWNRLHGSAVHFFPLVLLLAWRAAAEPSRRRLVLLALVTSLQALAGVYVAYALAVLLAGALPMLWWRARRSGRTVLPVLGAVAVGGGIALAAVAPPYLHAVRLGVIHASGGDGVFRGFVLPPAWVAVILARDLGPVVLVLAAAGLVAGAARAERLGLVVVAAAGFLVALGPAVPGLYDLLLRVVPGFAGIRAPLRLLVVSGLAASVLSGLGAAAVRRAITARLGRAAGTVALLGIAALLVQRARPAAPLPLLERGPDAPAFAAARWLRDQPDGASVLELPAMTSDLDAPALGATTAAMVASTLSWRPLVNGYTGHPPPSGLLATTLAQRLPDASALATLRRVTGVGWVVAPDDVAAAWAAAAGTPALVHAHDVAGTRIYRVVGGQTDLVERVRAVLEHGDDGRTLLDLSRTPLDGRAARGRLAGDVQRRFVAGLVGTVWVDVENRGRTPWPGLSVWPAGTVGLRTRWRDRRSGALVSEGPWLPLGVDLAPGGTVRAQAPVTVPAAGRYRLEIGLVQMTSDGAGRWFADVPGGRGLRARSVTSVRWPRRPPGPTSRLRLG